MAAKKKNKEDDGLAQDLESLADSVGEKIELDFSKPKTDKTAKRVALRWAEAAEALKKDEP